MAAAAFAKGARLHANRPEGALDLEPEILSFGTTPRTRRFGGLRLQCRVALCLRLDELPHYLRALAPPVGGHLQFKELRVLRLYGLPGRVGRDPRGRGIPAKQRHRSKRVLWQRMCRAAG